MTVNDLHDLAVAAADVESVGDLARLLRELRRREAQNRQGPELSHRQIASRAGWSSAAAFSYLTGTRLPSPERLGELARLFGAGPEEEAALVAAHARIVDAMRAANAAIRALRDNLAAPRALPAPPRGFTGRVADLARLDGLLTAGAAAAGTVLISAVAGMGGVGKTALAVHWAHKVADRFPDGQIYVNLRGYDPAEPLTSWDALGVVLGGLGVPPSALPSAVAERKALYHRLLAGRTMLVVLDNASGVEQVRPLLPPVPCLSLVTSRDDLSALLALNGVHLVRLDVLAEDDALALLRLLIGDRAARDPDAVRTLARLCGYLPLALRVAAEHVAAHPGVPLAELVAELGRSGSADLDALELAGDERADVRSVLSWSLRRMPGPQARAFRLLSLVPGPDIDAYGLASLAGVADVAEARQLAGALVRAHLLQSDHAGRYSMHDLVRAYASESALDLPDDERREAMRRLLDLYLATATLAVETKLPFKLSDVRPRPAPAATSPTPQVDDVAAASAWLATERTNLVRACQHAARHGWRGHAVALAVVLRPFLSDGFDQDGLTVLTEAHLAAEGLGPECEPADRVEILSGLAFTNLRLARLDDATEHAQQALAEYASLVSASGASQSLGVLGAIRSVSVLSAVHASQGRIREGVETMRQGLAMARSAGLRSIEISQLANIGFLLGKLEDFDAAIDYSRQAAEVSQEIGDILGLAGSRHSMAMAYLELGRYEEALTLAEEALAINVDHGRPVYQIMVTETIAAIWARMDRPEDAAELLAEPLATAREIGIPSLLGQLLNTLGEIHNRAGNPVQAINYHDEAHTFAEQSGERIDVARASLGLGDAHARSGNIRRARQHWTDALEVYAAMGLPAASRVEERLARTNC